jgi:hypothetical protein
MSQHTDIETWHERDTDDRRGTSTSDDEATLRDIGRHAFGIDYPRDVTPRQFKRLGPAPRPRQGLTQGVD